MTDLKFSVVETVHRRYGRVCEIIFEYEEIRHEQRRDRVQTKGEERTRHYQASITRDDYERIAAHLGYTKYRPLSFDNFIHVLRPFMLGSYAADEIREAFRLLDRNYSNSIDVDELCALAPVIHSQVDRAALLNYIRKVTNHAGHRLDFDQFNQLILRGIGRDLVCGHIQIL